LQGQDQKDVDAIGTLDIESGNFSEKDKSLLDFVKVLTLEPAKTRDGHVERMRKAGWTDEEIFEASFITSLFAFFNRMADAYGLDYPATGWFPPELRDPARPASPPPAAPPAPAVPRQ
jgi:alkylhydroperoxidase family enzyme